MIDDNPVGIEEVENVTMNENGKTDEEVSTPSSSNATAKESQLGTSDNVVGTDGTVRVSVRVLDKLMALAGEMVLTRNQLMQRAHQSELKHVDRAVQRVDVITTELQDAIMATRMQSVGTVFRKFKRVVRDLAVQLGKDVRFEMEGEDVELDRTLIEALGEPLTHLVRNAVDHGIEASGARVLAGKPPQGTIRLTATHQAGQVLIEIRDDGAGIDVEALKSRAMHLGLHTRDELEAMSERALLRLVFSPGLSTATSVTEVSGRGVGMDVVLSNLSQIGGVVDVETDLGAGTCISIKLPLTLAILPSLLLGVGDQRFAIPQVNLAELHRVPVSDVSDQVKEVGHALVLKLRGSLLPLVHLDDVLQVPLEKRGETSGFASYDETRAMNIAVISVGSFKYGLIVDELLDNAEIVVKPLGRHLSQCRWYAGATVLGDGRTALILDAGGIAESVRKMELDQVTEGSEFEREVAESERRQSLLLVTSATGELCAVPLEAVERIERINGSSLTTLRGRTTYISGGLSVPLFAIDGVPEGGYGEGPLFVVVNQVAGREVGLAVSEVVDTIETSATIDDFTHAEPGIRGSFVHDARTILLLDLMGIVRHERPELADWPNASAAPASESRPQAAV